MNPMTTRFTVKFWTYLLTGFGVGLLFNVWGWWAIAASVPLFYAAHSLTARYIDTDKDTP